MKNFTLILTFLLMGGLVLAQDNVVLTDVEGGGVITEFNTWSEDFTADSVANPIQEGLNQSDSVISYPAHWFTSEWGDFGGFLCFRGVGAENWATYNYLSFKYLIIQDEVVTGDQIQTELKIENGTGDALTTGIVFSQAVTANGANVWEQAFIAIPEDAKASDHVDVCIITSTINSADDQDHGVEIELYYDDISFTMTDEIIGIEKLVSQNGLSVYMIENLLNIKMDEASFVQDVQVFDMKGTLVESKSLNSQEQHFNMPVDLQSGVYVLRVRSDNETLTRKFVKL